MRIRNVLIPFLLLSSILVTASEHASIERQISALVTNGSVVLNSPSGTRLISMHPDKLLIPASIIKILTSAVAMDLLGRDFRFKTEIFLDQSGRLAIKGWGDPFLVSEEILLIAQHLRTLEVSSIEQIVLDHAGFAPVTVPGVSRTLNPYDAINGALVTNFNTLYLRRDAQGNLLSAEEATPLTPLAGSKANLIKAGTAQRISLLDNRDECLRYAGELFVAIFRGAGIEVKSNTTPVVTVDQGWKRIYTHRNSRDLLTVSQGLQKYSNNFIANQIFLVLGGEKLGYPATLEKGRTVFEEYIRTRMTVEAQNLVVTEGSGISRDNKVTGNVMMYILERFKDLAEVLPEKRGALVKSGTLTGVSNYAGYVKTSRGLYPLVIILNQPAANRDRILDLLVRYCALTERSPE